MIFKWQSYLLQDGEKVQENELKLLSTEQRHYHYRLCW